jgi:hypothetical protein
MKTRFESRLAQAGSLVILALIGSLLGGREGLASPPQNAHGQEISVTLEPSPAEVLRLTSLRKLAAELLAKPRVEREELLGLRRQLQSLSSDLGRELASRMERQVELSRRLSRLLDPEHGGKGGMEPRSRTVGVQDEERIEASRSLLAGIAAEEKAIQAISESAVGRSLGEIESIQRRLVDRAKALGLVLP